jgi:hypothetical protein
MIYGCTVHVYDPIDTNICDGERQRKWEVGRSDGKRGDIPRRKEWIFVRKKYD